MQHHQQQVKKVNQKLNHQQRMIQVPPIQIKQLHHQMKIKINLQYQNSLLN